MKVKIKLLVSLALVFISVLIHIYCNNKLRVETGYSTQFFVNFSQSLRNILGRTSLSIGDILYGGTFLWILWYGGKAMLFILKRKKCKREGVDLWINVVNLLCLLYIVFNVFWGINYNRKGIAWQLDLSVTTYNTAELKSINRLLVQKINLSKKSLMLQQVVYPTNAKLFVMVANGYKNLAVQYPFLKYKPVALKSSLWGWLGNYTGFTGYYNPFTGEAQVNTTVPKFSQPFTACHEVAHQLGYAKEMEANFVGYLAAACSSDTLFHYSVYLDLFSYANRNLYFIDSVSAKQYSKALSPAVVKDIKEWVAFNRAHQSPLEPIIKWLYGKFLQGNQQPQGLLSYDEVTGFIIAYYKKFGKI